MVKITLKFRRDDDGDYCTIEHHTDSERSARAWITRMINGLDKKGDDFQWARLEFVKEDEKK